MKQAARAIMVLLLILPIAGAAPRVVAQEASTTPPIIDSSEPVDEPVEEAPTTTPETSTSSEENVEVSSFSVTAEATEDPITVLDAYVQYPDWYVPRLGLQKAVKAGDNIGLWIRLDTTAAGGFVSAVADASEIGFPEPLELLPDSGSRPYGFRRDWVAISPDVEDGMKEVRITVTDADGNTELVTLPLLVDNEPPVATLSVSAPTTTLVNGSKIYWSGALDGTPSQFHLFFIHQTATRADGSAAGSQVTYSIFDSGLTRLPELQHNGTFTDVPMTLYIPEGQIDPMATHLKLVFEAVDGAGNRLDTTVLVPVHPSLEPQGASSVLFLPGFMGSRLYTKEFGQEKRLWEPSFTLDIQKLALLPDGSSQQTVYTRDVVDSIQNAPIGFSVYGQILGHLQELASSTPNKIAGWRAYSYDWRYDVRDVVNDGALKEDGSREYLEDVVEALASESFTGKVTIIGHSNGGLLAKALMVRLEQEGKAGLVDKVIMIGTPQLGVPEGYYGILHGRESVLGLGLILGPAHVMREVAATLPGAYGLMPSEKYFARVQSPLAMFDGSQKTTPYVAAFGDTIESFGEALGHATNQPQTRIAPGVLETGTPLIAPASLIQKAGQTHAILDAWTPPAGVEVHEIAGWGKNTMAGGIYYSRPSYLFCSNLTFICERKEILDYKPIWVKDGDDTVVTPSAAVGERRNYFNLAELNEEFDENRKHENLTESVRLHTFVDYLLGVTDAYETTLFPGTEPEGEEGNDIVVSAHSPVLFSVTDREGRTSGVFKAPNSGGDFLYIQEDIPGSTVALAGEGKYLILPEEGDYTVHIDGTGVGTFDIEIEEKNGQLLKAFRDIPVTENSKATIELDDGTATEIALDSDGNGQAEVAIEDAPTRQDAIAICKKEISSVRNFFSRTYLLALYKTIESYPNDKLRIYLMAKIIRSYLVTQSGKTIPQNQAMAIATCLATIENSK